MKDVVEQQIEELLRRDFRALDDDGFTAKVMRALPERGPRGAAWLPVGGLIGGLLGWWSLLPASLLQGATGEWLAGEVGGSLAILYLLLLVVGLLTCAWSLEEDA